MRPFIVIALQVSVICIVFGFGLAATVEDVLYVRRRPRLLVRSLFAVFVCMPLAAAALVYVGHFPQTTNVVLVALAMSPVPPLLPRREGAEHGAISYALGLTAVLSIAAIVAVPAGAAISTRIFGHPFAIGPVAIAALVVKTTLAPLAAGLLLRRAAPSLARRLSGPVALAGNVLLTGAVVLLVAGGVSELWAAMDNGTLLALVLFTVAGLAIGHVLGRPSTSDSVVLALATACRHPAIALAIATTAYPDARFGADILLYLLANALLGIPYLRWGRRSVATRSAG
jgi:BASS family bile acid:Na+ symporter